MPATVFRTATSEHFGFSDVMFVPAPSILAADFDDIAKAIRSFRPPLKEAVRDVMVPSIKKNFKAEGRPEPWRPVSEFTKRIKSARGHSHKSTLVETGKLKRAATSQYVWSIEGSGVPVGVGSATGPLSAGDEGRAIFTFSKMRGTNERGKPVSQYGLIMQRGHHRGEGWFKGNPNVATASRPFALIQDEDADKIEEIFRKWFFEKIDKLSRRGAIGAGQAEIMRGQADNMGTTVNE